MTYGVADSLLYDVVNANLKILTIENLFPSASLCNEKSKYEVISFQVF